MVTNEERNDAKTHLEETHEDRIARRIADLNADDPQVRKARPIAEVIDVAQVGLAYG